MFRRPGHFPAAILLLVSCFACDGAPESSDSSGKADVASERAKRYTGRDFYDTDRFDDDNLGRACGFVRERSGAITDATATISLESVTFPLIKVLATAERPMMLQRLDPERSLFERPVMFAHVGAPSDEFPFTITLFLNRLSLEPEIMLIQHEDGATQLCRDLVPAST